VEDDLEMDMVNDDQLGGTRRRRATTSTTELYSVDDLPRVTHLNDSEVCAAYTRVTISKNYCKITISIVVIFCRKIYRETRNVGTHSLPSWDPSQASLASWDPSHSLVRLCP